MHPFQIGKLIRGISKNTKSFINDKLKAYDLTDGYFEYLIIITEHEGLSQKELAEMIYHGKTAVTKAVKRLMNEDLITREVNPDDHRQYGLYVTDKGRKIMAHFRPIALELENKVLSGFTKEELDTLHMLLTKLYDNTSKLH